MHAHMVCAVLFTLMTLVRPASAEPRHPVETVGPVPNQPYVQFLTTDRHDRAITFYLSEAHPGGEDLPLLVYVQGSGCASHFVLRDGSPRSATGHSLVERTARDLARTLIVEKPGVAFLDAPQNPGTAMHATDEFRREHTLDRWTDAILAAIRAASTLPGVDASRVAVAGHSEGGIVTARLAARDGSIDQVALLAGGGPTQLYSLIRLSREGHFGPPDATPDERVRRIVDGYRRVLEDPDSPDRLFLGHPHRRWSSFVTTSPAEQLRDAQAGVLIVQGALDTATHPSTADALYAELLAQGRDAELMLIDDADHSLNIFTDGQITGSAFQTAIERLLDHLIAA